METETIIIHLPLKPRRRAGRKYLIAPDGATTPAMGETPQLQTMQKALVRAHLWRQEIESGPYDSITDFARKNRQDEAYVLRQLSLTFLAPAIIESILDNTQPRYLTLQHLYELTTLGWDEQKQRMRSSNGG
ncbi:MAG TPA: hypothetical protein DCY07_08800 [Rhodospirillaceae bacterium]|nr:hypothetical protein [Rhodospirillaceae bacterium]